MGVALRVQGLEATEQALAIARLSAGRTDRGEFSPRDMNEAFIDVGLPSPSKISNAISALFRRNWVRQGSVRGTWKLTPLGKATADSLLSEMDLAGLAAEAASQHGPLLGHAVHSVIPPSLAPPGLIERLRSFLVEHPFDTNVFAMTRFPDPTDSTDLVASSVALARDVCRGHGLQLHLASDRAIDDDLWTNVAAHMWASRYGIAFFEDRVGRGINYNLTIEVGSMLMTGRRCALLKDRTIDKMPTDFVGRIYKSIDFDDPNGIASAIHLWIRDDLILGSCSSCP